MRALLTRLEPLDVEAALDKWTRSLSNDGSLHIAIDGKTVRARAEYPASHLLSSFCSSLPGLFFQTLVPAKSNDISVTYWLLNGIAIKDNVISRDAIVCKKGLCSRIRAPNRAKAQIMRAARNTVMALAALAGYSNIMEGPSSLQRGTGDGPNGHKNADNGITE